ncbi:MAG: putative zinc-binding protein [Burkholderiales bacterium]|nr:putative zinc-binding protein [Burkholderiales bacterium]
MSTALNHLTLVYSCSGCSSAAQLANHLAVRLDRLGHAEMSCIAGIGGQVPSLVRKVIEASEQKRPILAIDGCALACVRSTLALHGVTPTEHVQLGALGVRKVYHGDFSEEQASDLLGEITKRVQLMNAQSPANNAQGAEAALATTTTP